MKGAQESGEGWREKVNLWLKEEEEVMGCLVKSGECVCVRREEVVDDEWRMRLCETGRGGG